LGYVLGLNVGLILWFSVSRPARHLWHRYRNKDGYQVLDSIILQAAMRSYEYRRFRPRYDLLVLAFTCVPVCIATLIYHSLQETQLDHLALQVMDGVGFAVMLFPVLSINAMGPWTGVFLLRRWVRRCWGFAMLLFMLIGVSVGHKVLVMDGHMQGALWGLLAGLSALSATHQKWYHVAALGFVFIIMIGVYLLMLYKGCWLLSQDSFVAVMGVGSLRVAPGWTRKQKLMGGLVGYTLLGGLVAIDVLLVNKLEEKMYWAPST